MGVHPIPHDMLDICSSPMAITRGMFSLLLGRLSVQDRMTPVAGCSTCDAMVKLTTSGMIR